MTFTPKTLALSIACALAFGTSLAFAQTTPAKAATAAKESAKPLAGQTVKIAWIDPLSGLMAPVGSNQLKSFQFFAEKFSASNPAGVKF